MFVQLIILNEILDPVEVPTWVVFTFIAPLLTYSKEAL